MLYISIVIIALLMGMDFGEALLAPLGLILFGLMFWGNGWKL